MLFRTKHKTVRVHKITEFNYHKIPKLIVTTDQCRDHGMDTQDLEFKFFAKRVESSYVVTATYV